MVGQQHARSTRKRDHRDTRSSGLAWRQQCQCAVSQVLNIRDLDGPSLSKCSLIQRSVPAQIGSMGGGSACTGLGSAHLPQQPRFTGPQNMTTYINDAVGVLKAFDIRHHHASLRIVCPSLHQVETGGLGFITGRLVVLETQSSIVGQHQHGVAPGTTL